MSWVAVAVGGASLLGGILGSNASQSAAQQQAAAANRALDIQQGEFNTITSQQAPFMQGGYGALSQLNYLLGNGTPGSTGNTYGTVGTGTPSTSPTSPITAASSPAGGYGSLVKPFSLSDFYNLSPAYAFQKQQGTQGVLNANAAGQGALSGAAQKDLIDYNQDLANTSFNNAFNQYQTQQGNIFSRLSGIAQLGQAAAANVGQQGTALAGNAGQAAQNIGTALAGGTVGSANALTGGLNSLAGIYAAYGGGGGQSPYASGSYDAVMKNGNFGADNSYGSGYTLSDYGA